MKSHLPTLPACLVVHRSPWDGLQPASHTRVVCNPPDGFRAYWSYCVFHSVGDCPRNVFPTNIYRYSVRTDTPRHQWKKKRSAQREEARAATHAQNWLLASIRWQNVQCLSFSCRECRDFLRFLPLVTADVGKIFDLHLFLRQCIAELLHHPNPTPPCLEDPLNPLVHDYHWLING